MITTEITDTEILTVSDKGPAVVFDRTTGLEDTIITMSQKLITRAEETV